MNADVEERSSPSSSSSSDELPEPIQHKISRMHEQELQEIRGLLEQVGAAAAVGPVSEQAAADEPRWRRLLKLSLPHVGLVVVCCLYSVLGAVMFYEVEKPHQDAIKLAAIEKLEFQRKDIISNLWKEAVQSHDRQLWLSDASVHMDNLTASLFYAHTASFVTAADIWGSQRSNKTASNSWTLAAAIFFSATTMTTIGFGNVVPSSKTGRMLCVFFALFGTPLAIITIGDMGKFLSEVVVWLYRKYKRLKDAFCAKAKTGIRRLSTKSHFDLPFRTDDAESASKELLDIEALITDKTQVPVLMVLSVLIGYIGLGAWLFAIVERWAYLDSFYFCFISLTTVGFGDLVPQNTPFYPLALGYIAIGLAITTMVVELVGIHYIRRIHYFGRKFQHTDLLYLLRRKKQLERLERRLALVAAQANTSSRSTTSTKHSLRTSRDSDKTSTPAIPIWPGKKLSATTMDHINHNFLLREPSFASTTPSVLARLRMYNSRSASWHSASASGPDISLNCSLHTTPSQYERERMYAALTFPDVDIECNVISPVPWKSEHSINMKEIAKMVKSQARRFTSPAIFCPARSPDDPKGMYAMENWFSFKIMEEEALRRPSMLPDISVERVITPQPDSDEDQPPSLLSESSGPGDSVTELDEPLYFRDVPVYAVQQTAVDSLSALSSVVRCPSQFLSRKSPQQVTENFCFVLDGDAVSLAFLQDSDWWRPTSRPTKYYYSDDGCVTFIRVHIVSSRDRVVSARCNFAGKGWQPVPLNKVFRVSRFYSYWHSCNTFHRIVTVVTPVRPEDAVFSRRIFVQYLWRDASDQDKLRVTVELQPHLRKQLQPSALVIPSSPTLRRSTIAITRSGSNSFLGLP